QGAGGGACQPGGVPRPLRGAARFPARARRADRRLPRREGARRRLSGGALFFRSGRGPVRSGTTLPAFGGPRRSGMTYVDGFVIAVPRDKQEAYRAVAERGEPLFKEFGATRQVEAWGDDVPDGKVTDFKRAVQAREDEVVVFGWLEYPDKATRDAAGRRMIEDPRMQDMEMPFDGKRMIYGGFEPIVDVGTSRRGGYVDGFLVAVPVGKKEAYRQLAQKAAEVFVWHGAV